MLDSVRDSAFLSSPSIVNPDGTHDGGLGITDNGLFVYTTRYVPGSPATPRQYPVKFFWIGSPKGTNDLNDNFSIYVADVNQSAFYSGAPASAWLVNPRLVLHWTQAKSDITGWFNANYPGGATGGVGSSNSGSNSQYGTLLGGSSPVGNVSGMDSLDGQFWPIYDRVDDSILLYFSIKTPNQNTLSIYCYKLTNSEIPSPAGAGQFLGGLSFLGWLTAGQNGNSLVLSSHRFSITSPDPMGTIRTPGKQSAVFAYSCGGTSTTSPDHGRLFAASVVVDIHSSSLSPGVYSCHGVDDTPDFFSYPVDKLGQIFVNPPLGGGRSMYGVLYNGPAARDYRPPNTDAVVISAMSIRVLYFDPATSSTCLAMGDEPILNAENVDTIGMCRPQFTHLPDDLPKIIYANFTFDQYLNIGYQYIDESAISPIHQKKLIQQGIPGYIIRNLGKKRAEIAVFLAYGVSPSFNPSPSQTEIGMTLARIYQFTPTGDPDGAAFANTAEIIPFNQTPVIFGSAQLVTTLDNLPPGIIMNLLGTGNSGSLQYRIYVQAE